jgi:hypothetical protein
VTARAHEVRRKRDLRSRSGEAGEQVEQREAQPAHAVFDVVAEDPQEECVAEQVSPATVQEHRRDRREHVDRFVVDDAGEPSAEVDAAAERRKPRELSGYEAEVADAGCEDRLAQPGTLKEHPDHAE